MNREQLLAAAEQYAHQAGQWFANGQAALRAKEQEILAQAKLNAPGVKEAVTSLTEVVRTLRQDRDLVQQHLHNALGPPTQVCPAPLLPGSSLGSALLAMNRSITGWLELQQCFPEREDEILDLLLLLDRLRRAVQTQFPDAP